MSLSFAGVLQKGDGSLIELQSFYPPNVNEFIGSGQKRNFDCGSGGNLFQGFDDSFSNNCSFFQLYNFYNFQFLQTMLAMYFPM